jgi:hypothetical protein
MSTREGLCMPILSNERHGIASDFLTVFGYALSASHLYVVVYIFSAKR